MGRHGQAQRSHAGRTFVGHARAFGLGMAPWVLSRRTFETEDIEPARQPRHAPVAVVAAGTTRMMCGSLVGCGRKTLRCSALGNRFAESTSGIPAAAEELT